jgi:hypothetical protein
MEVCKDEEFIPSLIEQPVAFGGHGMPESLTEHLKNRPTPQNRPFRSLYLRSHSDSWAVTYEALLSLLSPFLPITHPHVLPLPREINPLF